MTKDTESIIEEFKQAVNMTPKKIEAWLKTEESKEVGQKDGNDESIGHKSGQKIIEILQKKQDKYTRQYTNQTKSNTKHKQKQSKAGIRSKKQKHKHN